MYVLSRPYLLTSLFSTFATYELNFHNSLNYQKCISTQVQNAPNVKNTTQHRINARQIICHELIGFNVSVMTSCEVSVEAEIAFFATILVQSPTCPKPSDRS